MRIMTCLNLAENIFFKKTENMGHRHSLLEKENRSFEPRTRFRDRGGGKETKDAIDLVRGRERERERERKRLRASCLGWGSSIHCAVVVLETYRDVVSAAAAAL